ncbi:hypothetical protein ACM26V_16385 [Salipaludibacillus sp. HK11]|uniref:hypothetical protein n=1 Tax=Salipaludibacillus sp. HK11 TaxID=3394320 RepID=UPI0039FC443E
MNWFIGLGLVIITIVWTGLEFATYEDRGAGFHPFINTFKKTLLCLIPLFALSGVVYYVFFD